MSVQLRQCEATVSPNGHFIRCLRYARYKGTLWRWNIYPMNTSVVRRTRITCSLLTDAASMNRKLTRCTSIGWSNKSLRYERCKKYARHKGHWEYYDYIVQRVFSERRYACEIHKDNIPDRHRTCIYS